MGQMIELDEYETVILGHALSYGRVESSHVSALLQELVREKGQNTHSYEIFNRSVARLQQKKLLDEKYRVTARALEEIIPEQLRSYHLQALRRITELESEKTRIELEKSQAQSETYTLRSTISQLENKLITISPPTHHISKEALTKGLSHFVGYEVANQLSEVAKNDLESAMRCIMHGIPTPAAMVSLRASEETIRRYYQYKFGHDPGDLTWAQILEKLDGLKDIDKTLLGNLHYIRKKRNEAEHPKKIFNEDEAEHVFEYVINVIKEIYGEILQVKS